MHQWQNLNIPVIMEENPSMTAHAVRTLSLADDTPVRSDTTTKILRGTRNNDDSYWLE
jgi:hypothetical protein